MNREMRSRLAVGILMVLVGAWFLVIRFVPALKFWSEVTFSWPMIILIVALGLLVLGLLVNAPGMAVPACVVGGIGAILYYQYVHNDFGTWAFAWTLIPGFVGIGVILEGLLVGRYRSALESGGWLIFISAVLFVIFGSFLGGPALLGNYWPVLVILFGLWLLVRPLFRSRR